MSHITLDDHELRIAINDIVLCDAPDCDRPATWALRLSCCDAVSVACAEHKRQSVVYYRYWFGVHDRGRHHCGRWVTFSDMHWEYL
jgi:hypothetical protein